MLVRTDIPLADQIVQVGHVCLEAGRRFVQLEESCHLVLLAVPSEPGLCAAVARAEAAGVRCEAFYEPDDEMGYTAACTEPLKLCDRRLFRRYPLWRCR